MELQGTLAADQQPVTPGGGPGVEIVDRRPHVDARAPAGDQVALGGVSGGQVADVDGVEDQVDGGKILVVGHHLLGHGEELGRLRGHDLRDPDPHQARLPDEVHVLVAALHQVGPHPRAGVGGRHPGQGAGIADIGRRRFDPGDLVGAGQQADLGHR